MTEERNLVLIGLPGSGKTTVGRALADLLGREFLDLDEWVTGHAGASIPDLFADPDRGERYFRELENDAVRFASALRGCVIATGGGSVLREENVQLLRKRGLMIFLDRTPDQLTPTDTRPLSDTREKLTALYLQRLPLYQRAADLTVDYYAPKELPSPPAAVAAHLAALLRERQDPESEAHPCA